MENWNKRDRFTPTSPLFIHYPEGVVRTSEEDAGVLEILDPLVTVMVVSPGVPTPGVTTATHTVWSSFTVSTSVLCDEPSLPEKVFSETP